MTYSQTPPNIIPYRPGSFYQYKSLFSGNVYYVPHSMGSAPAAGTSRNARAVGRRT